MASTSTIQSPIPDPDNIGEFLSSIKKINDSIYMFPNSPNAPKAEILFFHDVQWKDYEKPHVQSWTLSETPNVCWPEILLKPKYPDARIWYVHYDGDIRKTANGGHMTFFQTTENLRHDILRIYAEGRPVVLIGHGFGGLIIKGLIEGMANGDPLKQKFFVENVKGMFYFAPPFMGTKLVDSMKDLPSAGSLVKFLEVTNAEIAQLNQWFSQWRRDRRCKARAIIAALPTELEHESKMAFWSKGKLTHVVEEGSARYDVDICYASNRNHFGVSKLGGENDSSFQMLTTLIDEVIPAIAREPAERDSSFQRLTTLIDEVIPEIAPGPAERIPDGRESACDEFINNILRELPKLNAFYISSHQLQEISEFPEKDRHLSECLEKARFEATSISGACVLWEKCQS